MKTATLTTVDVKGYLRVSHEYRFTLTEKATLAAIAKGLYSWCKPGHVNFRGGNKLDESDTVALKPCLNLHRAGLLESDPMACHGYQFNLTDLGRTVAASWSKQPCV